MTYKGYEIQAEAYIESGIYSLDDEGYLQEFLQEVDIEPTIDSYCVIQGEGGGSKYGSGEEREWFSSITECKGYIDVIVKEKENA